jgi:hypothetical protein
MFRIQQFGVLTEASDVRLLWFFPEPSQPTIYRNHFGNRAAQVLVPLIFL